MKAYRFRPNQNRRVHVRWHDRGWTLTLDSCSGGSGMSLGTGDQVEEMNPVKARFPIAMGPTIPQPLHDSRHRR
jgi:hypothetical protein